MSSYANASTDLPTYGLPANALVNIPLTVQQAACDDASDIADSYINGRYMLPLLAWPTSLTQAVCKIAAYNLMSQRGYNPAAGADENLRLRYEDAIKWLDGIQRQAIHPLVTQSADPTGETKQPNVTTSSVTFLSSGFSRPSRGW